MPKFTLNGPISGNFITNATDGSVTITDLVMGATPVPAPTPVPVPVPTPTPTPTPIPIPPVTGMWEPPARLNVRIPATSPIPYVAKAVLAAPAVGASVVDPNLSKMTIKRLTATAGPVYSQLQAFSKTEDAMMLVEENVGYSKWSFPAAVKSALALGTAPRWYGDNIYYFAGPSPTVMKRATPAGVVSTTWTAPAALPYFKGAQVEEAISENGWTVCWSHSGPANTATMIPFNVDTGQEGHHLKLDDLWQPVGPGVPDPTYGKIEPNWVAMSPTGKYLILAWARDGSARCCGMELFDAMTGAFVRNIYTSHQHGACGILNDGSEFYLSVNESTSDPTLFFFDGRPKKVLRSCAWGSVHHICVSGPKGWGLFSGYDLGDGTNYGLKNELWLLRLEGPTAGEVIRLCNLRSTGGYFSQPKQSWSKSGLHVVWNEDWGTGANPWCAYTSLA